jgi:hypothetical protein
LCFGQLASYIPYLYLAKFLKQCCRSVTFWCWGSVPLFHGSGLALDPDSALYISCQQKKFFLLSFFAYYFEIEGTFTSVLNVIKS